MTYADSGAGGGILTISDGLQSVQLHLVGNYQASDFGMGADGLGGLLLTSNGSDPLQMLG
jgi:hypothetical protein